MRKSIEEMGIGMSCEGVGGLSGDTRERKAMDKFMQNNLIDGAHG